MFTTPLNEKIFGQAPDEADLIEAFTRANDVARGCTMETSKANLDSLIISDPFRADRRTVALRTTKGKKTYLLGVFVRAAASEHIPPELIAPEALPRFKLFAKISSREASLEDVFTPLAPVRPYHIKPAAAYFVTPRTLYTKLDEDQRALILRLSPFSGS